MNEKREYDRIQREEYTRRLKESIFDHFEQKSNEKNRIRELRDKNLEDRLNMTKRQKAKFLEDQRQTAEMKLKKAKEDIAAQVEQNRLDVSYFIFSSLA